MAELRVGTVAELANGNWRIVSSDGKEIGVRQHAGEYFAYVNRCVHQGGPACEGVLVGRVEEEVRDRDIVSREFSETTMNFVCPWHGYEYDLRTGEFVGDRRKKLRKYEVVEREGEVFVVI